jgi:hypothetical protein
MPTAYSYVDGAELACLALEVRGEFIARPPYGADDTRRPNSVRLVAVEVIEGKTTDQQLSVLADLLDANPGIVISRDDDRDIFQYSDTPATYLTDLICEVVCLILARDPSIRKEDSRRTALALRGRGRAY